MEQESEVQRMNIPDHPEIACALATGYPHPPKELDPVYCSECGIELTGEDKVYDYDGEPMCANCFVDHIMCDTDAERIAQALGYIVKSAADYAEELLEE